MQAECERGRAALALLEQQQSRQLEGMRSQGGARDLKANLVAAPLTLTLTLTLILTLTLTPSLTLTPTPNQAAKQSAKQSASLAEEKATAQIAAEIAAVAAAGLSPSRAAGYAPEPPTPEQSRETRILLQVLT